MKLLDERTIAFADLRGNRQYISSGNLIRQQGNRNQRRSAGGAKREKRAAGVAIGIEAGAKK